MATYDFDFFDTSLARDKSDSIKWTVYGKDVIPLWIADMDFRSCEEIVAALKARAEEGCYGYARECKEAIAAMIDYHREHYHWDIDPTWVIPQPGVVTSLNLFCKHVRETRPERCGMFIGEPVYHHFMEAAKLQQTPERKIELAMQGAPLPPLETLDTEGVGGWLFCNPENPLGHTWSERELRSLLDFAEEKDILFASDEIHGGLTLDDPYGYVPILRLAQNDSERARCCAFVAPSKTFNVAGLGCAFAIVPDPTMRAHFMREYEQIVPCVNIFGWVGAKAAYRHGEAWRLGVLKYLKRNRDLLADAVKAWELPMCNLSSTYLAFVDGRSLLPKLAGGSLKNHFLKYGVAVHDGAIFGAPGWLRINIATQTATLQAAIERMGNAIAALNP